MMIYIRIISLTYSSRWEKIIPVQRWATQTAFRLALHRSSSIHVIELTGHDSKWPIVCVDTPQSHTMSVASR